MATAKEVFEKVKAAALAATGSDERALQIDYEALEQKMTAVLGNRNDAPNTPNLSLIHISEPTRPY